MMITSAITLYLVYSAVAVAWTDKTQGMENFNSLCKFEPEAQCTSAVRIGAKAPGINMKYSSMEKMRLDGAKLQRANFSYAIMQLINLQGANIMGAILIQAKFDGATWVDGRVCSEGSIGECR